MKDISGFNQMCSKVDTSTDMIDFPQHIGVKDVATDTNDLPSSSKESVRENVMVCSFEL